MKIKLILSALVLFAVSSCTDDSGVNDATTEELVQHKWNIKSIIDKNYLGASTTFSHYDTLEVKAGDFVDFRTDNKAYMSFDGDLDTSAYNVINDLTIKIGEDVYSINVLNDINFVLQYEERTDTPYFDNIVHLTR